MSNPFRYFNSSPEVIRLVVMMYVRYPLSLRNVDDLPEIEIIGRPLPDQSACRMSDDRNVRIVHGADDAPGLRLAWKFEMRVDCGDDEVEARQNAVRQVERAVLQNVDLDPLQ